MSRHLAIKKDSYMISIKASNFLTKGSLACGGYTYKTELMKRK